jgi:hypothetical protein
MKRFSLLPWFAVLSCHATDAARVDAGHPGGNIRELKREGRSLFLAPDQRDRMKGRWWFFPNFRLQDRAGERMTVVFTERNPICLRGPAVNHDEGRTWK